MDDGGSSATVRSSLTIMQSERGHRLLSLDLSHRVSLRSTFLAAQVSLLSGEETKAKGRETEQVV